MMVVEDSADAWRLIERALGPDLELRRCKNLDDARRALDAWNPDLVLLDIGLPDGDGFSLCSEMQNEETMRDVPVVFLTGRDAVTDKVTAFGLGADDFVEKPFHAAELRARVSAHLRKRRERAERNAVRVVGPLRIDRDRFVAHVREGDTERDLGLTAHELRLLAALVDAQGRVLSRTQLVSALVGECVITERTVDTHLCNLRRKLGPLRGVIETVRGVGYRLVLPDAQAA